MIDNQREFYSKRTREIAQFLWCAGRDRTQEVTAEQVKTESTFKYLNDPVFNRTVIVLVHQEMQAREQLERELFTAKAEIDDLQGCLDNSVNECRDSIERLGLSNVPNAGSLKSDEAVCFVAIAEREIVKLRRERDQLKKAAGFCDKHKPDGGSRNCLVCAVEELSAALHKISYACGQPNEMEVSEFSTDCNPDVVIKQVEQLKKELSDAKKDTERWTYCIENKTFPKLRHNNISYGWVLEDYLGRWTAKAYPTWQEAIDSAIEQQKK